MGVCNHCYFNLLNSVQINCLLNLSLGSELLKEETDFISRSLKVSIILDNTLSRCLINLVEKQKRTAEKSIVGGMESLYRVGFCCDALLWSGCIFDFCCCIVLELFLFETSIYNL